MNELSWVVFRQVETIRESLAFTLKDGAVDWGVTKDINFYKEWLVDQGVPPVVAKYPNKDEKICFLSSIDNFISNSYPNYMLAKSATCASRYSYEDIGKSRSGIGWDNLPNFVITAAFIRLLGSMEQFELDVLKSLLYYRPNGKSEEKFGKHILADIDVITEEPNKDGDYRKPAIWTWMKKSAENNHERRKILKNVYGLEYAPIEFENMSGKNIRKFYNSLYEKRNAIAHGRLGIIITLSDYCKAEVFLLRLIERITKDCKDKYSLLI